MGKHLRASERASTITEAMDSLLRGLRLTMRSLAGTPGVTGLAVATLALGIAATTATWSVIDGVLLRPLPFPAGERLIEVWRMGSGGGGPYMTLDMLETVRDAATSLEWVEGYLTTPLEGHLTAHVVAGQDSLRTVEVARVTPGLLPALGVPPVYGRHPAAGDGPDALVVREDLWRQIGTVDAASNDRRVDIDGRRHRVVGVMPATFRFPNAGTQAWAPPDWDPETRVSGTDEVYALGRRRPDASLEQARDELAAISRGLREQGVLGDGHTLVPDSMNRFDSELRSGIGGYQRIRSTLYVLLGAVAFVLLITCANTANLMLARAARKERDTAVRQALGASPAHIVRQFLAETGVIGAVAGVLGGGLAAGVVRVVASMMPPLEFQDVGGAAVSLRALLVVVGLSVGTGIAIGLVPALRASRGPVAAALTLIERTGSPRRRLSGLLVVTQIALCLMLLAGAGLLVRSFVNRQRIDLGFDVDRVVVVGLSLPASRYGGGESRFRFMDELSTRLMRLPGVQAAAMAGSVPPAPGYLLARGRVQLDAASGPRDTSDVFVSSTPVGPGYFDALGIPLLEGRAFTREDDAADRLAIVDAATARSLWPGRSAIGKRFRPPQGDSWLTVVGVVGETRQVNPDWQGGELRYYEAFPFRQVHTGGRLVVRSDTPEALLAAVRQETWAIDPRVGLLANTMAGHVRDAQARPRFAAGLMSVFALVGLLLAAGGTFSVVSCDVSRRTREIGIRMALGATRPEVMRLVLRRGVTLIALGSAMGLAGAAVVTSLARSVLFEVDPIDPLSLVSATVLLIGVALAANWLPARRAARVEPVQALRIE